MITTVSSRISGTFTLPFYDKIITCFYFYLKFINFSLTWSRSPYYCLIHILLFVSERCWENKSVSLVCSHSLTVGGDNIPEMPLDISHHGRRYSRDYMKYGFSYIEDKGGEKSSECFVLRGVGMWKHGPDETGDRRRLQDLRTSQKCLTSSCLE